MKNLVFSCWVLIFVMLINSYTTAQVEDPALKSMNTFHELKIHEIDVNTKTLGRAFEGVGALSAGASSRLLYDYPEPQRSDILDYLFKPNFGASMHHLKVEIGGDVNSTDGSEPSHAITREEFENPKPEYFFRGYEWWLMKEAKKRNPDILLEGLQWGAPGWIGDGDFFSEDNAEFVSAWIIGMKKYHNLNLDYVGIWNERKSDLEYIKLLRKVLDRNGLQNIKINAGDLWQPQEKWEIAFEMDKDKELQEAVDVINAHTTAFINFFTPPVAKNLGIPLWDGEAHAYGGDWYAAAEHARFNRAYVYGKITKMISWSLISSYHDYLIVPSSGPMKANTPWSGYYEVQPPIWIMAHTNQFARPGWRYIDSACKGYGHGPEFMREGFSVTTLKSDMTNDYSIIIETMDAKEPQKVRFNISGDLSNKNLKVWRSVFKREEFVQQEDIVVNDGVFEIKLIPDAMYSLTTSTGQQKGIAANPVPETKSHPFPYFEDFEQTGLYKTPKYFSDQHGTFEVVENPKGKGKCLMQKMPEQGIQWRGYDYPQTVLGDLSWKNYTVSVDILLPDTGSVNLLGRMNGFGNSWNFPGYVFEINHLGDWTLKERQNILASGKVNVNLKKWTQFSLSFMGNKIEVKLNNNLVTMFKDDNHQNGVVGLGTGWNIAYFDNIKIEK